MTLRRLRSLSCPRVLVTLMLAAICANLGGCATTVAKPTPVQAPVRQWQASELIGALEQRNQQFRSLRALARVNYAGPEGKQSFQEAILVQRPDRLRLETLTFLGAILIVTVNGAEVIAHHPREGIMLRGAPSKQNLVRLTQLPLELSEVTMLLTGLPPVDAKMRGVQEGNALIFSVNGRRQDRVAFESQLPVPTEWQRFAESGEVELVARFSDYVETSAGTLATRLQIEAPLQNKRLEIRIEEPDINGAISADLFTQSKPAHVKEYRMEGIGW